MNLFKWLLISTIIGLGACSTMNDGSLGGEESGGGSGGESEASKTFLAKVRDKEIWVTILTLTSKFGSFNDDGTILTTGLGVYDFLEMEGSTAIYGQDTAPIFRISVSGTSVTLQNADGSDGGVDSAELRSKPDSAWEGEFLAKVRGRTLRDNNGLLAEVGRVS